MPTTPPSITALPSPPDPANRATFNTLAYPWSVAQQTLATQLGAVATNVYDNALEAQAAAAVKNTDQFRGVYAAGTTYQQGQSVLSGGTFWLCNVNNTVGITPVEGANWAAVTGQNRVATAVASAATINLNTATGDYVSITGTTTISTITLSAGYERTLVFAGALTLTYNATTLMLPGNANITTAAGDVAIFRGDGTGVRCVAYNRRSGLPLVSAIGAEFVSANQTITANGLLTLAHGLGGAPKFWQPFLVCTTADTGYAINDIVAVNPGVYDSGGGTGFGQAIYADATNVYVRFGPSGYSIANKTLGTPNTITNANWRLVIKAYR